VLLGGATGACGPSEPLQQNQCEGNGSNINISNQIRNRHNCGKDGLTKSTSLVRALFR
jgi:hypothetical protein